MGEVKLFGCWASPFSMRVEIALKMKGVEYEYVEEDLRNKSDDLVKYNPIHKKVPVLVHDQKPIAESLVIMEYIDEVWKGNRQMLLPSDPYERAQARFWAKFIDDKLLAQIRPAFMSEGEENTKAIKELDELFEILDTVAKEKKFLGGPNIGFVDIIASIIPIWVPCWQEVTGKVVLTREKYPWLYEWADELLEHTVIKQYTPDKEKLQAFYRGRLASVDAKASR